MEQLKVEVISEDVRQFSGVSNKTGKPFVIRTQQAFLHRPKEVSPYPQEFQVTLNDEEEGYKKGFYQLDVKSFYIGRFMDLLFRPRLIALK